PATSIRPHLENPINIYPNPVRQFMRIDFPNAFSSGQIEIFDRFGRSVLRKETSQSAESIDLQALHLTAGQYFLRLHTGSTFYHQSFLFQP
ncbi:MAG: T9SS type A sorting domain-containing protein, partial [Bacteroidota bacterium]